MANHSSNSSKIPGRHLGFLSMLLLLLTVITLLLGRSYLPGHTLFSNDGPLGRLMSDCHKLPESFTGVWEDLNSIGFREQGALPNLTYGLRYLLKPILFSKFYVSVALIILGLSAWGFFRQSGLAPVACLLGGLAAVLNSDFFSTACWGIAAHPLAIAMCFLALAALMKTESWRGWVRVALAGLAVGMGMAEGADVGAILSLYVGAFLIYQTLITDGPKTKSIARGAARLAIVVVFAAFMAAQAISALVNTQVEGVLGMGQDSQTREEHWNWATQWSLPKSEIFSLVVPGLFGYRTDAEGGANYWGSIGRAASWEKFLESGAQGENPGDVLRQTGGGIYAGITVVLVAVWAGLQAFRRDDSIFNPTQRKWLWFWMGVIGVSLPLAFGRHAPFYQLIYRLPYFSTIRNPVKFIALVNLGLIVMFAFGVDGLWRRCVAIVKPGLPRLSRASVRFDNLWIIGCVVGVLLGIVAWIAYANSRLTLQKYLVSVMFKPNQSRLIAEFSINQVVWFLLFLIVATVVVGMILKGSFAGKKANIGFGLLGLVMLLDLGRADLPWIRVWNYEQKYASNPVIDLLRQDPFQGRVALEPFQGRGDRILLDELYHFEWAQHQFQYYNIQSIEVVQLPRVPQDLQDYGMAMLFDGSPNTIPMLVHRWELTNTRYIMGSTEYLQDFNTRFDPVKKRFHIKTRFNIARKPNVHSDNPLEELTAQIDPQGVYALFEFTGGLPRAKLYSRWEVNTNRSEALKTIAAPAFDPEQKVVVSSEMPADSKSSDNNENAGTVDFISYSSKQVKLSAKVLKNSILLYNDRYDPNWKVLVDGNPAPLLHCNFIMRGVFLTPGEHSVEFSFQPPSGALKVSLAAICVGIVLVGLVSVGQGSNRNQTTIPAVDLRSGTAIPQSESKPEPKPQRVAKAEVQPTAAAGKSNPKQKRKR